MRGRIALQKHFVRNAARCLFLFREARHGTSPSDGGLSECVRVLAPLLVVLHVRLRADPAQVTFR